MRIVLTHPYCWPWVRRGAERFISELARYLTSRGHEVVTISTKPGRGRTEVSATGTRILQNQMWVPLLSKIRIHPHHMFLFSSFLRLLRTEADIVHSLYYTDAYAAYLAGKWKHHRTIYHVAGPPVPEHLPRIPPDRWILKQAIDKADTLMVSSAFTGEVVRQHYDREAQVLPAPIELRDFPEQEGFTPKRPTILSVADFNERRKGVRVLVEAFERVKARVPSALLFLSGQMSPRVKSEVLGSVSEKVRADIEVLGVGGLEDLPQLYQKASVTVLPSMWESYGRVLLESWACGTPVVATNHGGFPELVTDPSTGVLFDPKTNSEETTNSEGLAEAIHQVLALEQDGKTAQRCRSHAEQYSWEVLGGAFEDLYCKE